MDHTVTTRDWLAPLGANEALVMLQAQDAQGWHCLMVLTIGWLRRKGPTFFARFSSPCRLVPVRRLPNDLYQPLGEPLPVPRSLRAA
jgi:hypothetical protein